VKISTLMQNVAIQLVILQMDGRRVATPMKLHFHLIQHAKFIPIIVFMLLITSRQQVVNFVHQQAKVAAVAAVVQPR